MNIFSMYNKINFPLNMITFSDEGVPFSGDLLKEYVYFMALFIIKSCILDISHMPVDIAFFVSDVFIL